MGDKSLELAPWFGIYLNNTACHLRIVKVCYSTFMGMRPCVATLLLRALSGFKLSEHRAGLHVTPFVNLNLATRSYTYCDPNPKNQCCVFRITH